jgi:hypothetical protein
MLREWQRHGIKDLTYFPQDNAITASIDKVNSLGIKPVTFRIELFVVLKNGRKAGLSLARCSQLRGAASSFRKVIEVLEQVGRDRGLLVDDESQWNELCGILTWELTESSSVHSLHGFRYALANVLLGHGSSFVFYFLFTVLGCWDVDHEKREIPFLSEWSFCVQGKQFWPVQHPIRSFSFVSQNGVLGSEDFLSW